MKEQELIEYFLNTKFNDIKLRELKEGEIYKISKNNKYDKKQYSDCYNYYSESQEIDTNKFNLVKKYKKDKFITEYINNSIDCVIKKTKHKIGIDHIFESKKYYDKSGILFRIENYEYDKSGKKVYKQVRLINKNGKTESDLKEYNSVDSLISCGFINDRLFSISKFNDNEFKDLDYHILIKDGEIIHKFRNLSRCDIEISITNKNNCLNKS